MVAQELNLGFWTPNPEFFFGSQKKKKKGHRPFLSLYCIRGTRLTEGNSALVDKANRINTAEYQMDAIKSRSTRGTWSGRL